IFYSSTYPLYQRTRLDIYPLSLHDALPISGDSFCLMTIKKQEEKSNDIINALWIGKHLSLIEILTIRSFLDNGHSFRLFVYEERSEEHTSELQSRENLVCRLLLEKKNASSI